MHWRSIPQSNAARRFGYWTCWAVVVYIVAFWRLGFPSFWDPDEAVYAVATREMLRTGDWLAPMFNGAPFFDKPILFYWLQLIAFKVLGPTEFAARLVPAVSAVGVIAATGWAGRVFFNRTVGTLAALIVAVLPATFALSAYAILDMTFTAFLFAGVALTASAALHDRPRRQWWGYLAIALAVLTKGPLAIALAGMAFIGTLIVAPRLRPRLLSLHWISGATLVVLLASPWFIYMWLRFGYAFIEGYFLRENIWLYASQLFTTTRSPWFYVRVVVVGFLPWTPILAGRLVDAFRGDKIEDEERLFWVWAVAITLFFTGSRFKLDHYVYPVLPALSIIAARAASALRSSTSIRQHLGTACGILAVGVVLITAGVVTFNQVGALPLDLPRAILLAPIAMMVGGLALVARMVVKGFRPRLWPAYPTISLLAVYGVVLMVGFEAFERAKPVKDLASWVALNAPGDATITAYQLERWRTSWRFYADRPMRTAETPDQLHSVFDQPGTHYAVMLKDELEAVQNAAPDHKLRVVRERRGLSNTSGRGLRKKKEDWPTFVIVTSAAEPPAPATVTVPAPPQAPASRPARTNLPGRPRPLTPSRTRAIQSNGR